MAYIVGTKKGAFEIRESRSTPAGPRSFTLAGFRKLTDDVIAQAQERAKKPPSAEELRQAALKAGAPIAGEPADEAARTLLRRLARGGHLDPMLRTLLLETLTDGASPTAPSDAAHAALEWIGAEQRERGDALRELLLLADALPSRKRPERIGFPRLRSA